MFKRTISKCIEEVQGLVVKVWINENGTRRLTVAYKVNGKDYKIREGIKEKKTAIKFMGIPIGQKSEPYIKENKGDYVTVKYNPDKPRQAYIKGNGKKKM
ncbi:MAG: hypothetical protein Q4Q31_12440 [Bacillota bacterium]|nr:hypothetical protein [Bacillota bacterium]